MNPVYYGFYLLLRWCNDVKLFVFVLLWRQRIKFVIKLVKSDNITKDFNLNVLFPNKS